MPSERSSVKLCIDWTARPSARQRPPPCRIPFWLGTEALSPANSIDQEYVELRAGRELTKTLPNTARRPVRLQRR
jgi:hypothetical protein